MLSTLDAAYYNVSSLLESNYVINEHLIHKNSHGMGRLVESKTDSIKIGQ
jgi:hypothetical protein